MRNPTELSGYVLDNYVEPMKTEILEKWENQKKLTRFN